ncbi:MAG: cytochrome-c oxidase, cbb3-type subunit III [Rickettsiales bacterium]|nr:cytochrome-c oxidase, cbb3-type subunit III [Rickettsiales bacterium]
MTKDVKQKDEVTGVETTGHEWDGIQELNNPAPRWWLWVFYITIIWSIGYWVVYPAWPTLSGEGHRGGTVGTFESTQYTQLAKSQEEIVARRAEYMDRFKQASFDEIMNDPELYAFAQAGGESAFKDNCATCHGTGGAGAPGYPNLNDDEWIWGGDYDAIYHTIRYGVRNKHMESRTSMMPEYGDILSKDEIMQVTDYVYALGHEDASMEGHEDGAAIFAQHCASCHGADAKGMREVGSPNLTDAIWLKSENGSKEAIASQIRNPKHGVMPVWEGRLDEQTIRQLTIYVHALGGGE